MMFGFIILITIVILHITLQKLKTDWLTEGKKEKKNNKKSIALNHLLFNISPLFKILKISPKKGKYSSLSTRPQKYYLCFFSKGEKNSPSLCTQLAKENIYILTAITYHSFI